MGRNAPSFSSTSSCSSRPRLRAISSNSRAEVNGCGSSTWRAPSAVLPNSAARTTNPPPVEKYSSRCSTLPAASSAVKRMPFGCCGKVWSRWNSRSIGSSNTISCWPARRSRPLLRIRSSVGSIAAGSSVAGSMPSRPSRIARSVQWPRPVSASDPYSCAPTFAVRVTSPSDCNSRTNAQAAFIGPIVWELDGPTPILKMSRTERFIGSADER